VHSSALLLTGKHPHRTSNALNWIPYSTTEALNAASRDVSLEDDRRLPFIKLILLLTLVTLRPSSNPLPEGVIPKHRIVGHLDGISLRLTFKLNPKRKNKLNESEEDPFAEDGEPFVSAISLSTLTIRA
jgi:hypothetical protein